MTTEKKGRPTPSRKEAQAKRVVSTLAPAKNKEDRRRAKEQARAARVASRAAFLRGDENALPSRDRGPARRFVRNYIDSRRWFGEYMLPTMALILALSVIPVVQVQLIAQGIIYFVFIGTGITGIYASRSIKREVAKRFPGTSTKGLGLYGWMRSTQVRRFRTPQCQVKVGERDF